MNKKRFTIILVACLIVSLCIVISDYYDFPSRLGIMIDHINMNLLTLVVSNAIVIILFLITFHFIDARNLKAEERNLHILDNKRTIGLHMIEKTCMNCKEEMKILTPEIVAQCIVPKVDFDTAGNSIIVKNIKSAPFIFDEQLKSLFVDGSLLDSELDLYLNAKNDYEIFVGASVTFFDAQNLVIQAKQKCELAIEKTLLHCEEAKKQMKKQSPFK